MQLKLTVMRDNKCIETITLAAPKEATFGRKSAAGLADKQFGDERLSSLHFRICPEGDAWRLEDLRSLNGTKVQGQLVKICLLNDEDEIAAGKLIFRVSLMGGVREAKEAAGEVGPRTTPMSLSDPDGAFEVATKATRGKLNIPISSECSENGQTFFRGAMVEVQSAAELVLALRQIKPFRHPWLIVDQSRMEAPLPESLAELAVPIVDWLGPEYANSVSPRLIDLKGLPFPDWEPLMSGAWGKDTVIILFGEQKESELLQVLRNAVRQGTAISGVLWASVLSYMLLKGQSGPATQVMSACTAILMELPDLPEVWLLVGPPALQKSLEKLGMVCAAPLESAGTNTAS